MDRPRSWIYLGWQTRKSGFRNQKGITYYSIKIFTVLHDCDLCGSNQGNKLVIAISTS